MRRRLRGFWLEDNGQDLVEYSLLMAFFVFTVFALAGTGQAPIRSIWDKINSHLASGVVSAHGG